MKPAKNFFDNSRVSAHNNGTYEYVIEQLDELINKPKLNKKLLNNIINLHDELLANPSSWKQIIFSRKKSYDDHHATFSTKNKKNSTFYALLTELITINQLTEHEELETAQAATSSEPPAPVESSHSHDELVLVKPDELVQDSEAGQVAEHDHSSPATQEDMSASGSQNELEQNPTGNEPAAANPETTDRHELQPSESETGISISVEEGLPEATSAPRGDEIVEAVPQLVETHDHPPSLPEAMQAPQAEAGTDPSKLEAIAEIPELLEQHGLAPKEPEVSEVSAMQDPLAESGSDLGKLETTPASSELPANDELPRHTPAMQLIPAGSPEPVSGSDSLEKEDDSETRVTQFYRHHQTSRIHFFTVTPKSRVDYFIMDEKDKGLEGDALKAAILRQFARKLAASEDVIQCQRDLEATEEYQILRQGQGICTRMFGLKTDSVRAFESMVAKFSEERSGVQLG